MGKKKSRVDRNKASSHPDITKHGRQVDPQSNQALHMAGPDVSVKRSAGWKSPHEDHGTSHKILLRQSHHHHPFGRHYSRRSSSNYCDASPSNWKGYDTTKLSFKPESKDLLAFPYRGSRIFQQPERIRCAAYSVGENSGDLRGLECKICHESSLNMYTVVAVLVCGHVYHVDCLEQKTSQEDIRDPPCPVCVNQT